MVKKINYKILAGLDNTKKTSKVFATKVRLILKEFLFEDLEQSNFFDKKDLLKVRHSIINFFYCGKFTLKCQNPIIYDDNAQKELLNVSNTANEIRHTLSKISIINENLIKYPTHKKLNEEVIRLEK
jgi:hypothetical protein